MTQPFKKILVIDFETAWDKAAYTLSNMTTEAYIRDPRFRSWGAAVKFIGEDESPTYYPHGALASYLSFINWSETAVVAHNAMFDIAILTWRYGYKPCFIFDSLSMARALYGVEIGNSLAKLADRFDLPPKGNAVHSTSGYYDVLPPLIHNELAAYCCHDVFLCEQIFTRMLTGVQPDGPTGDAYPTKELRLIDMTIKMFTNPVLELDEEVLQEAVLQEHENRTSLLNKLGATDVELASSDIFAGLLRKVGVEPPMKDSKTVRDTAGRPARIYAFAKTDVHFKALLEHENDDIATLAEARLAVKSTLTRTRGQRFLDISRRGALPVPLRYYAALNTRWGGADSINLQNLKRGGAIRRAIVAPKGDVVVVGDLSQIEPRVLAWLSDYREMLQIFNSGGDPYATFGAQMFHIPGLTKESHPELRQSAKSALLGCGYGLGWANFAGQLLTGFLGAPPVMYDKAFAKMMRVTQETISDFLSYVPNVEKALAIPHICTEQELIIHCISTKEIVNKYRSAAKRVVKFWELCDAMIAGPIVGGEPRTYKFLEFSKGKILLPNGMYLRYPNLHGNPDEKGRVQWTYGIDPDPKAKTRVKLFGGKLTENIVSAVARCIMTDGMLRVNQHMSVRGTVHDEFWVTAKEEDGASALKWMLKEMSKEPKYMPGLPLAADGGFNRSYGNAKN